MFPIGLDLVLEMIHSGVKQRRWSWRRHFGSWRAHCQRWYSSTSHCDWEPVELWEQMKGSVSQRFCEIVLIISPTVLWDCVVVDSPFSNSNCWQITSLHSNLKLMRGCWKPLPLELPITSDYKWCRLLARVTTFLRPFCTPDGQDHGLQQNWQLGHTTNDNTE